MSGGCAPYTYAWSTGATSTGLNCLTPGLYQVTVTDANGCQTVQSITLTQAPALGVTISSTNVTCYGAHNGTATANVTGGCGPYSYTWTRNWGYGCSGRWTSHSASVSGLYPGSYTLTVVDNYGCRVSTNVTITQPARLRANAGSNKVVYPAYGPAACVTLNGSVSGGTPPYTTSWSGGSTVCPTVATTYYYTVTDANGCSATDSVRVCPANITCASNKILICHRAPGSHHWSTQCVATSTVASHLSHGDRLGACNSSYSCNFPRNHGHGHHGSGSGSGHHGHWKSDGGAGNGTVTPTLAMRAFPNPTNGMLDVELLCQDCEDEATYELKVSDIYGHVLMVKEINVLAGEGDLRIDLSNYSAGVYMISVNDLVQRIMKQ